MSTSIAALVGDSEPQLATFSEYMRQVCRGKTGCTSYYGASFMWIRLRTVFVLENAIRTGRKAVWLANVQEIDSLIYGDLKYDNNSYW